MHTNTHNVSRHDAAVERMVANGYRMAESFPVAHVTVLVNVLGDLYTVMPNGVVRFGRVITWEVTA